MSEVVRIAHVALQLETGGMERMLAEFARYADRRRYDVQFVALGSRGSIASAIESAGCRVTALNARHGIRPALVFRLARYVRDQRIDIVHTHNTKPLLYAGPAARLAGAKAVIHTRHGQRHRSTPRQNLLFKLAARCADRMVCVSEDSRRLCRHEGVDPRSTHRIWNGIDPDHFSFKGPSARGPAVFVGRLSIEKDVATLLKATAMIVGTHPTFRLQIAGAGSCRTDLSALADSLGLKGHVDFLGNVSDIAELLGRASMFVLPSLTEGLPLTVLEAMACGLPVVATRVGGTPEAVEHGVSGLLCEPQVPGQLAQAMQRLWNDPALGRKMGLAGRQRVTERFDVRTMVSRYESLYEEVLGGSIALAG